MVSFGSLIVTETAQRITHLSPHALRHTFDHDLIVAKNDLQQVATYANLLLLMR